MEEKNELNDIILNKGGNSSGSKKLLLAIATLTLILIIVLVIMSSLKRDEVQKSPQAILPPQPSAPTEVINDPLFEPVEVLQDNNGSMTEQTLDQVAQKIKQESLQNAPIVQSTTPTVVAKAVAKPIPTPLQNVQVPTAVTPMASPTPQKVIAPTTTHAIHVPSSMPKTVAQPTIATKPEQKKIHVTSIAPEVKKATQPKSETPIKTAPANTPKIKQVTPTKTTPVNTTQLAKSKEQITPSAKSGTTYHIQVGSFSTEPDKALIGRLDASGLKYTSQKIGGVTKVLVGPFHGEKATQDAMDSIRKNIEAKAFKIKG